MESWHHDNKNRRSSGGSEAMKSYLLNRKKRALTDPFGPKVSHASALLRRGVDFNDLKPGREMLWEELYPFESCCALQSARSFMQMYGLSVEDMKKGTFYGLVENGKNLKGEDISLEEAPRIIQETNDKLRDRYFNNKIPEMDRKMTPEEVAAACQGLKDLRRKLGMEPAEEEEEGSRMKRNKHEEEEEKIAAAGQGIENLIIA